VHKKISHEPDKKNAHGTSEDLILKLFCRFLFVFLRSGEALLLFATGGALPDIISTVIVPHRLQHSPACRALATRRRMALAVVAASLCASARVARMVTLQGYFMLLMRRPVFGL